MISNNVSPLEMKSLDSKKTSKKSKTEDDSFKKEMLENEKRMKKKSVDGREGTVNANSTQPHKHASKKEPSTAEGSKSAKKVATPVAGVATQNNAPVEGEQTAAAAQIQQTIAGETSAPTNLEAMAEAEIQMPAMEMAAFQNALSKEGKLSIEGMQAVQPQLLQQTAGVVPDAPVETAAPTETLLAAMPVAQEQKSSDLLSQDFNQDFSGFNAENNFSSLQNGMVKENAPNQQVFASVLEGKLQTPEQVRDNNVENIISQARAILKDGGGEMKVKMTPEGLGTIDLKVGVQNGQVSVEILAQDQNVKKMFEDSVFDIRSALETQNLKIDTFKVGVSQHFDQPAGQQNAGQQFAEREFARDFMGQFRDERQGLRNQGIDNILNNRNGMGAKPEGLSPAATKIGNGRLNIVA